MKYTLILIALFFTFSVIAQTGEKNFIDQNYIEVIGKADMEIIPDKIYISIIINEKDMKGKSLSEIDKLMFDRLDAIGVDISKDIAIKDLLSNFQYYWFIKSDMNLTKEYQVITHDAKTTGKVFFELQKLDISNISIEKVENSKIVDYRKEVKIAAIKAAKEKATFLATAIDQNIGRAIFIQEIDNNLRPALESLQGRALGLTIRGISNVSLESQIPNPDIEFEKIKLEANILVRFELK